MDYKTSTIAQYKLPTWIIVWLIFGMSVNFWDALYILLRPSSFADGPLGWIWIPYAKYVTIDPSYLDLNNDFIKSIALMNFVEIALGSIAIWWSFHRRTSLAALLAFSSLLLTGTKTALVFALEAADSFVHIGHNSASDLILLYALPNSLWLVFPLLGVINLGRYLTRG